MFTSSESIGQYFGSGGNAFELPLTSTVGLPSSSPSLAAALIKLGGNSVVTEGGAITLASRGLTVVFTTSTLGETVTAVRYFSGRPARLAGTTVYQRCFNVELPFGFSWNTPEATIRSFFCCDSPLLTGFPRVSAGGCMLTWPGVTFELCPGIPPEPRRLIAIEYTWPSLAPGMRELYASLCQMRLLHPGRFPLPTVAVTGPAAARERPVAPKPAAVAVAAASAAAAAAVAAGVASASVLEEKPVYILAVLELKEAGRPLRYADISARLAAKGYRFGADSVMGSLSGFYSTVRGKTLLNRISKGEYELREGYAKNIDADLRHELGLGPPTANGPTKRRRQMHYPGSPSSPTQFGDGVASSSSFGAPKIISTTSATASPPVVVAAPSFLCNVSPAVPSRRVDDNAGSSSREEDHEGGANGLRDLQIGMAFFERTFLAKLAESRSPFYQLAQEILRAAAVPMHYRDIAAVLRAAGRSVHQDTIMGSLNGFINTSAGRAVLARVGKGTYTLVDLLEASPAREAPANPGKRGRASDEEEGNVVPLEAKVESNGAVLVEPPRDATLLLESPSSDVPEEVAPMVVSEDVVVGGTPEAEDNLFDEGEDSNDQEMFEKMDEDDGDERYGDESRSPAKRISVRGSKEPDMPTFLDVYYLFRAKFPGNVDGLTLKDMSEQLSKRAQPITTQRLNSRLSAYSSYRRKKNLPQLFDRKAGKFSLSAYGKKIMADPATEKEFLRTVFSRGK